MILNGWLVSIVAALIAHRKCYITVVRIIRIGVSYASPFAFALVDSMLRVNSKFTDNDHISIFPCNKLETAEYIWSCLPSICDPNANHCEAVNILARNRLTKQSDAGDSDVAPSDCPARWPTLCNMSPIFICYWLMIAWIWRNYRSYYICMEPTKEPVEEIPKENLRKDTK